MKYLWNYKSLSKYKEEENPIHTYVKMHNKSYKIRSANIHSINQLHAEQMQNKKNIHK